jgi:uncharacterized membrane protein YbhN (UPF0104 family)
VTAAQRVAGRVLLATVGLGVIAYLVYSAGAGRVAETLWQARAWLPLVAVLGCATPVSDFLTLRLLLGPQARNVPAATWLRSSTLAYAMMICLPAGRAAGEVARASLIAKYVGATRAAIASMQLQASYVFAIGVLSAVEAATAAGAFGVRAPLALLLGGNAILMMALTAGFLATLRDARIGRWLDRLRRRFTRSEVPPPAPPEPGMTRSVPWRALLICCISRGVQALEYGVILCAVGGMPSIHGALLAHGIELVGSTLGEFFPNQIGVVDTAYRTFASDVGFGSVPARALSIVLLARVAHLLLAAVCIAIAAASRPVEESRQGATSARPADASAPESPSSRRVPLS